MTVAAEGDLHELGRVLRDHVPGVREVDVQERVVLLHATGSGRILPAVVNAAEDGGFVLTDLKVAEPTLETVFIRLTGKELRD